MGDKTTNKNMHDDTTQKDKNEPMEQNEQGQKGGTPTRDEFADDDMLMDMDEDL
jgi:hypothetical protein